jgi:ubiquinone/menaquinone biosynthesis C-methylase UbiE
MLQLDPFVKHAEEYDQWFDRHAAVYESELQAVKLQMLKLPENIHGIEIGMGTGRFSADLGIKEGIEPVAAMARMAVKRGVEVMKGTAERLPYRDLHFDFVLFVTICHLDNVQAAFKETYRVLKRGGSIIVGFLDRDQTIAQAYDNRRDHSEFYRHATFYPVNRVETLLKEAGFTKLEYMQTLFGKLEDITELQTPEEGFGKGSFVVVKALKK